MNFAWRIYRRLAQAFPHEFNLVYGEEMMQAGEDVIKQLVRRRGAAGFIRLIADIAIRLPLEYASEMRHDMRYALRALIKSPGFALAGIVSMGLGIALTTHVYSSNWALMTRELPAAANAKRLVMPEHPMSYYYIEQYRDQNNLFAGVAAFENGVPFNVRLQGEMNGKPERVFGQLVSPDYFSVLGVRPQRGRLLSPEVDKPGGAPVVVISDRFWRNRLNSSSDAVGQMLRLNGHNAMIVGITPRNFDGALATNPAELFVPITVPGFLAPELANNVLHQRDANDFLAMMCLAPGISIEAAEAALDGITRRLDQENLASSARADKSRRVTLLPAGTRVPIPRKMRLVVMGFFVLLMGLIMAIACLNVATMLLARAANRRKEIAIRLGIGASRFRLIRQMISEGILLSLLGGVAGFGLAYGLFVLDSQLPRAAAAPLQPDLSVDWHAAVFALAVAIVCGIAFSLAPGLQATNTGIAPTLKEASALQFAGYRRFGLRNLAMGAQVAGSLMLLLITGFLVIGIASESNIQSKFDPKTMVLLSIDPVRDGYSAQQSEALFEKLIERLKTAGNVRSFALAAQPPFSTADEDETDQLTVEDPRDSSAVREPAARQTVGAGYFGALSEPMLAGRDFEDRDERIQTAGPTRAVLPVILNQSAAHAFFGNSNAIGKRLRDGERSYDVAGVVRDFEGESWISQSIVYVPLTRRDFARPPAGGITILVRSNAARNALSEIRSDIASLAPNLTIFNEGTLSESLERSRYITRAAVRTYGGMGLFGLLLSAIGLSGVTAYAVAQRRREIGIRMALGARKGQVLHLVLREGTALITAGTVLGFLGAVAMAKILSALTSDFAGAFKTGTNDPRLLVGAPLLLMILALLACYVPARRATKVDPLTALREE